MTRSLPGGVRRTVLKGGLRVVTEHMPGVRSAAVGVYVQVGSRDEAAQLNGASHFLEHLLFKGTTTRSAMDISAALDEVGERYLGTVVKTTAFGAFVSLLPGKDGLLHISKLRALAGGKRVEAVEDVVAVGQKLQVEIAEIDDRGKLSLIPVVEGAEGSAEPADAPEDLTAE